MSTSTRITVEQYDEMIRQGQFEPREEHHVELIHGEIVSKNPFGLLHENTIDELAEWSFESLPRRAVWVRVRGSLGIPGLDSVPEPDLLWVRRGDYFTRRPGPADALLVIEVSDSSLDQDRDKKARLYAEAGVADFWIVNLPGRCVEVHRDPRGKAYRSVTTFRPGQEVHPLAFPDVVLPVARLFLD